MSGPIKLKPEEVMQCVHQVAHDVAGIESITGSMKYEITQNTCKSVVDFERYVTNFTEKTNAYTAKFKKNLEALGRATDMMHTVDKSLKEAIASEATSVKAASKGKVK